MSFLSEKFTSCRLPALLVLAIFYGIYFLKMLAQRRCGIKTNQIGSRKEKDIHIVELLMSAATLSVVAVQLVSVIFALNHMPQAVRFIGFFIGITGDIVFLCAVVCMKSSWRAGIPKDEKTTLVTKGIYAISRNPAFLGFDLMYIGVALMFFNFFTLVFSCFAITMLHLQILQEEKYMIGAFGSEYDLYKNSVLRYIGIRKNKAINDTAPQDVQSQRVDSDSKPL